MKEYKITFCGCGDITSAWLLAIKRLNNREDKKYHLNVIAACDPIPKKFRKLRTMGFRETKQFSDLSLAYKDEKSDITIITAPPQLHPRYVDEAIENDNHVIAEKPLAIDYNQYLHMREVADIADKKNLHAVVNQQYRWDKRIASVKKAVEENLVGDIDFVVTTYITNKYHFMEWWRKQHMDMCHFNRYIHHYDTIRYLLNKNPVTVRARFQRPRWSKIYGESTAFVNVTFEGGIEWSFTAAQETVAAPPVSDHGSFIMYGSKGTIRHNKLSAPRAHFDEDIVKTEGKRTSVNLEKYLSDEEFKDQIEFEDGKYPPGWSNTIALLIKSIETGVKHPTCLRDNFWTISMPLCARESHNNGGIPINVKEYMQFE